MVPHMLVNCCNVAILHLNTKMKETLLQTCNLMYNVYKVRITDLTAYRDTSGSTDITATQDLSRSVMLHHICIWHAQRALI